MTQRSSLKNRERLRGEAILCCVAMTWGTTYIVIQDVMAVWPPMALVSVRFALAFLCVLPFLCRSRITADALHKGVALGFLIFLTFGMQNSALAHTSSPRVAFAAALVTVFVPIFAWFVFRTRWQAGTYIAVVSAFLGVYYMMGVDLGSDMRWGDLLALGGVTAYTLQVMLLGHFTRHQQLPLAPMLVAQFGTTSVLAAASSWALKETLPVDMMQSWELVAYLGIVTTCLCLAGQLYGQARTTPTRAGFIYALEPISAALLAWMFQGQHLSRPELVGGALILVAAVTADQALPAGWQRFRRPLLKLNTR